MGEMMFIFGCICYGVMVVASIALAIALIMEVYKNGR